MCVACGDVIALNLGEDDSIIHRRPLHALHHAYTLLVLPGKSSDSIRRPAKAGNLISNANLTLAKIYI